MKKRHPLKNLITELQSELHFKCSSYSERASDSINLTYYSNLLDLRTLRVLSEGFTQELRDLTTFGIRDGIQMMLDKLQNETGIVIDTNSKFVLEAHIENQLRKRFMDSTLEERMKKSFRVTATKLQQTYQINLSGLSQSYRTTFLGDGLSIYGWNHRLITTELLRTYHYTVQTFAKFTNATSIEFKFDEEQLEKRQEYQELADGGPYKVDDLPDYPRPYASYLLKINY